MKYIFIINGHIPGILEDIESQLKDEDIEYGTYVTTGTGDGERYVRIWSDLHEKEEVCFVACGGSGTVVEVAAGICGFCNKSMAMLAYGATNDLTKHYPGRNFHSIREILEGEEVKMDIIKAGDSYSLNVINLGFEAEVARRAYDFENEGLVGAKAFRKAIFRCLLFSRSHKIKVVIDGKPLGRKTVLQGTVSNASWCGGQFLCSPRAVTDDGLAEVCVFRPMSILFFLISMMIYKKGKHLDHWFTRKMLKYYRAKKVELSSSELIYMCNDGEITAATHFDIEVLEKAITFVLPKIHEEKC